MNDEFIIKDIEYFVNYSRVLLFNLFGKDNNSEIDDVNKDMTDLSEEEKKELDTILSYDESLVIIKSIAKEQKHKITKKSRYIITDELFLQIIEALNDRMTSNLLNGLVNRGLVETAYDDEAEDFVFWVKENKNK
jgi:thiaminase